MHSLVGYHLGHSKYMHMHFCGPLLKKASESECESRPETDLYMIFFISLEIYDKNGISHQWKGLYYSINGAGAISYPSGKK